MLMEDIHIKYHKNPETLVVRNEDRVVLLDIGTTSLFQVDPVAHDVLCEMGKGEDERDFEKIHEQYGEQEGDSALGELKSLAKLGFLTEREKVPGKMTQGDYDLVLTAFHGCNLRCLYCFADGGKMYHGNKKKMEFQIAKQAIDYVVNEYADELKNLNVNFTSGGEPLINFELFKQVDQYCKTIENENKGSISIRCTFASNGTLLDEEVVDYLDENDREIGFSVDGPPEVHDAMRYFPNKRGTYDKVIPRLLDYKKKMVDGAKSGRRFRAGVTLTAKCTDFVGILTHIIGLGFDKVSMKPARLSHKQPESLNAKTLQAFKDGYTELGEFLVAQSLEGNLVYIESLANHSDFFLRIFYRLLTNAQLTYRCRAPKAMLAVTADGDIYPCADFIGVPEMKIGDVFDGVDEARQAELLDLPVDQKPGCKKCWARYVCGGGCYAAAMWANGDVKKPDTVKCQLIKHIVVLSLQMIAEFQEKDPQVLTRVQAAYSNYANRVRAQN